ncbi:MFS transporter [Labrys neptuniae]
MATTVLPHHSVATWPAIVVVVGAGIAASIQVGKMLIAAPVLKTDLGLDLGAIGWLTGLFALLGLIGGIPAGTLIARFGDRLVLLLGLAAIVMGSGLGAVTSHYGVLLASRILEGLGYLMITVAGPAILNRISPAGQRDLAFGLWSCFMPAGMAIALLAGPFFDGWRSLWWTSAAISALAILVVCMLVPGGRLDDRPASTSLARDALAVASAGGPLLLALCFALYTLMFFALFSFLPVLLMQRMGMSYGTAGFFSAVATAANIIGNLAAGYLISHGARRALLIAAAGLIMGTAAPCVFLQVFPDAPTLLLCILFSAAGGLIPSTLLSSAPILAPKAGLAPIVVGLIMQGSGLGQVVGPIAVGGLIDAYGWASAGVLVIAAAALAIIVAWALARAYRLASATLRP